MREPEDGWVAGVCTGIAANVGWPVSVVRLVFLALMLANGLSAVAYLAYWVVMPLRPRPSTEPHDRQDRLGEFLRLVAFGLVAVATVVLGYVWGWATLRSFVAPVVVLAVGLAILWQRWDTASLDAPRGVVRWAAPLVGVALVAAGVVALIVGGIGWVQGVRALTVVLLLIGGAALLALPWWLATWRTAAEERRGRIAEQARAEPATQVHDSVLQTLALIQANAADPAEVARLARTEERRLRSWLYEPVADEHASLAAALRHAAADVEDQHGAVIEVVMVGDCGMTPTTEAVAAAGREAMVNAAKHTGPMARVSVYSEVADGEVKVFIRDRGSGFDLATVPADRHGVRDSIVGRLERVGGTATVVSTGQAGGRNGTEVRLVAPVAPEQATT